MTDKELLDQQNDLQERARLVLGELNLLKHLQQYGDPSLVGSLTLGLMAWPDIDIEVYVKEYSIRQMTELAYTLIKNYHVSVHLRDYRLDTNPNKPKGLYLGIKHKLFEESWKLDIWFLKPEDKQPNDITQQMTKLTDKERLSILRIKSQVWDHPEYRKGFASVDIYTAVLLHGVSDIKGFEFYLNQTERTLA